MAVGALDRRVLAAIPDREVRAVLSRVSALLVSAPLLAVSTRPEQAKPTVLKQLSEATTPNERAREWRSTAIAVFAVQRTYPEISTAGEHRDRNKSSESRHLPRAAGPPGGPSQLPVDAAALR